MKKLTSFLPVILIFAVAILFIGLIAWQAKPNAGANAKTANTSNQNSEFGETTTSGEKELVLLKQGESRSLPQFEVTITLQSVTQFPCPGEDQKEAREACLKTGRSNAVIMIMDQKATEEAKKIRQVTIPSIPGVQSSGDLLVQVVEYKDNLARIFVSKISD